jgi:hypothetical protein
MWCVAHWASVLTGCAGPGLTTAGSSYSLMLISTAPERSGLSNSSQAGDSTPKSRRIDPVPFTSTPQSGVVTESRPLNEAGASVDAATGRSW